MSDTLSTLRAEVLKHAYNYYIKNSPTISDEEYDKLFKELKHLEMGLPGSITTKVACGLRANTLEDVPHSPPMLSLDNIFDYSEYTNWAKDLALNADLICTPKLDGASLALYYYDRVLVNAVRRGDGDVGQSIMASAINIKGIPATLSEDFSMGPVTVRGEVVCPTYTEKFSHEYKTHRNFVSGSMNLKDAAEISKRELSFYAYRVLPSKQNYSDSLELLHIAGFNTVADLVSVNTSVGDFDIDSVLLTIRYYMAKYTIPLDGIVLMLNDVTLFESLGATGHHPRGATAYKMPNERKPTRLLEVLWQVGKTGIITPVAILEPVELEGTTVTRATLHNLDEIRKLGVAINDTVLVTKAAFIIPKILEVVQKSNQRIPITLFNCPACGTPVKQEGAYIKCSNKECGEQSVQKIVRFTKNAKFVGFGEQTIRNLQHLGLANTIPELFRLTSRNLVEATSSDKIAEKLFEMLQTRPKSMTFIDSLSSINIPHVNRVTAQKLVDSGITSVFDLRDASMLIQLDGFGAIKAHAISAFVQDNLEELADLNQYIPLQITAEDTTSNDSLINVVISGKVPMSKTAAKAKLLEHGYNLQDNVTKQTHMLVLGTKPGKDKISKCQKYGIRMYEYPESDLKVILG